MPMGRGVFDLPAVDSTVVETGEAEDCTVSTLPTVGSSRPSSQSEELTVDSPVDTQSNNVE